MLIKAGLCLVENFYFSYLCHFFVELLSVYVSLNKESSFECMDLSTTRSSSTESIETQDIEHSPSSHSLPVHQMDSANEQIEELTKQLNESKSAEKRANDERDKYIQMYNRTSDRFLAFERKQLDQLRLILTMLTPDQQRFLSGKTKFVLFFYLFFIFFRQSK